MRGTREPGSLAAGVLAASAVASAQWVLLPGSPPLQAARWGSGRTVSPRVSGAVILRLVES